MHIASRRLGLKRGLSVIAAGSAVALAMTVFIPAQALLTPVMTMVIHGPFHNTLNNATVLNGTQVHQKVTMTGDGPTVTGTVDFTRYKSLNCSTAPLATQEDVPIVGGVAESSPFTLTSGNWSWRAHYSGDENYAEADGPCRLIRSRSRVLRVESHIHDENHNDITFTMVPVGTVVHDQAVVTVDNGPQPTGTVDFHRWNNGTCSGTPASVEEDVPLVNGEAESEDFMTTTPGMISYRVFYNPDANYQPHFGICEKLTVTPAPPFRMTGGGSLFVEDPNAPIAPQAVNGKAQDEEGMRVTHGFTLRCDATKKPQRLEINWDGNRFHLLTLIRAFCSDNPAIEPNPPDANFDTYEGEGTGRYNGVDGAKAHWIFTDAGEPGEFDTGYIEIEDANGMTVLLVTNHLDKGNHQAHKDAGV